MNPLIINIPPRTVRPAASRRPLTFDSAAAATPPPAAPGAAFPDGGGDDLRQLAREIVRFNPLLAILLERSGQRRSQQ